MRDLIEAKIKQEVADIQDKSPYDTPLHKAFVVIPGIVHNKAAAEQAGLDVFQRAQEVEDALTDSFQFDTLADLEAGMADPADAKQKKPYFHGEPTDVLRRRLAKARLVWFVKVSSGELAVQVERQPV